MHGLLSEMGIYHKDFRIVEQHRNHLLSLFGYRGFQGCRDWECQQPRGQHSKSLSSVTGLLWACYLPEKVPWDPSPYAALKNKRTCDEMGWGAVIQSISALEFISLLKAPISTLFFIF